MFFEDHLEESDHDDVDHAQVSQEATRHSLSERPSAGGNASSIVELLKEAAENERHCPDILPYPSRIVESAVAQLARTQIRVRHLAEEEKREAADPDRGRSLLPFKPSDIIALELQRAQFFLCELLRCRLRKVEMLATTIYYEGLQEAEGAESGVLLPQRRHLSENEKVVADRLAELSQNLLLRVGLQAAPPELRRLTPNPPYAEGIEVLPVPDIDQYVFGVALEDLGVVDLGENAAQVINGGEIFLMPYRTFRPYVISGHVRLL